MKLYSWEDGVTLLLAFLVIYIIDTISDKLNNHEVNLAFSIRKIGLIVGSGIAFIAPVSDMGNDTFLNDLSGFAISSAIIIVFIFLSMIINDKILLKEINNNKVLKENNIAVGILEAGTLIATGIILYASISGEGVWWSSVVFFILGQASFILLVFIYNLITKFDIKQLVKEGNASVSIVVSGIMIASAIILKSAIIGDNTTLLNDLKTFGIDLAITIVLVIFVLNGLIDKIFMPETKIYDEIEKNYIPNTIIYSSIKIALAFVISALI